MSAVVIHESSRSRFANRLDSRRARIWTRGQQSVHSRKRNAQCLHSLKNLQYSEFHFAGFSDQEILIAFKSLDRTLNFLRLQDSIRSMYVPQEQALQVDATSGERERIGGHVFSVKIGEILMPRGAVGRTSVASGFRPNAVQGPIPRSIVVVRAGVEFIDPGAGVDVSRDVADVLREVAGVRMNELVRHAFLGGQEPCRRPAVVVSRFTKFPSICSDELVEYLSHGLTAGQIFGQREHQIFDGDEWLRSVRVYSIHSVIKSSNLTGGGATRRGQGVGSLIGKKARQRRAARPRSLRQVGFS